jgi:hypothetical protein
LSCACYPINLVCSCGSRWKNHWRLSEIANEIIGLLQKRPTAKGMALVFNKSPASSTSKDEHRVPERVSAAGPGEITRTHYSGSIEGTEWPWQWCRVCYIFPCSWISLFHIKITFLAYNLRLPCEIIIIRSQVKSLKRIDSKKKIIHGWLGT